VFGLDPETAGVASRVAGAIINQINPLGPEVGSDHLIQRADEWHDMW
jgi:hypothetical protein